MTGRPAPDGTAGRDCVVLVNTLGRHSLWPADLDTPADWPVAYGPASRPRCLDFIARACTRRPAAAATAA
ncbi:MbtH family NRPS accessory protein [Streptomyces sp. DSM 118148]|uniref:MbtH family NRPS accessory protein n=1 Tax=Streptomyces sp. DSM 118148 TaxID=3448667 RepID=UPI00404030C2